MNIIGGTETIFDSGVIGDMAFIWPANYEPPIMWKGIPLFWDKVMLFL